MKNTKIYLLIIGGLAILGALIFIGNDNTFGANPSANTSGEPVDLIGTKTGTTTTNVAFAGNHSVASTTYPFLVGADKNTVSITLYASSTATAGSDVHLAILSSNDFDCNTATTTTIFNVVKSEQINWYDATPYLLNYDGSLTMANGTSTVVWSFIKKGNKQIVLTNLNTKCLALEVNASSTVLSAQFLAK